MQREIKHFTFLVPLILIIVGMSTQAIAGCSQSLTSDGNSNTCIGKFSLNSNSSGVYNTSIGYENMKNNTTGIDNTSIGTGAMYANIGGNYNVASGYRSLYQNTTGHSNTGTGDVSLYSNKIGVENTATGRGALMNSVNASYNTAMGYSALFNATGSSNIAIGHNSGYNLTNGSNNIAIGNQGVAAESATIRIGTLNTHTRTFIAGIRGVTVSGGAAVYVKSDGQLGTVTSSRRYKEDIQPMGDVSNRLMSLQPVTFRYKEADSAGNKPIQYGLIAEDVDLVMPEIVVRNEDGLPETVAYHVLPSLLLNEYQKQHKELSDTKVKLAAYDDALTKEHLALLDAREKIAVMHSDMELMKQTIDRLIAVLPRTTAAMLQQQ